MRDRLQEFIKKAKDLESESSKTPECTLTDNSEPLEIRQQAVIFEKEPILQSYLDEIHKIQKDINQLSENVKKFGEQQKILVSSMRRFSVLKKDSSITKDIKLQTENIKKRLDLLAQHARKAEADCGASSGLSRILKTQHAALFKNFQNAMLQYNQTITGKQDKCKTFIRRQLEVAGKDISEEEINTMVEQGQWDVFNENLLTDVKITKAQLSEIEQRHRELRSLENQMKELKDIFFQISQLVEEQGEMIENIEMVTKKTEDHVQRSNETFKQAVKWKKKNPCKTLFCCCFPCC
ncbi:syntaxin-19 [Pelobates cultripes]|uniref:Syntaxin-19 n=1 Tax=Pelobates cultripes TaxID=61616 RepID=A0AAD1QXI2_PELCU|nr:syntaxin-19 [Pelobates cultripes]